MDTNKYHSNKILVKKLYLLIIIEFINNYMAERANTLHILTNNSGNYIKLHNGSTIGVNLKDDLRQYFTLLFLFDYRYDYYNWVKLKVSSDKIKDPESDFIDIKSDYFVAIPDEIINYIKENAGSNNIEIPLTILDLKTDLNSLRDDSYKLGKVPYLEIMDDGEIYYYVPKIVPNENYKEQAIVRSDLEKLDILFKTSNYGSIDDLVLLDFYKAFKYKIENLKNKIIENDDDIKKAIEEELIEKLKTLYKIKPKDIKVSNKIGENIRKRAKSKEYLNFIGNDGLKGGGKIPIGSLNITNAINKIKEKTTELDDVDINILIAINQALENNPTKPNKPVDVSVSAAAIEDNKSSNSDDKKSSENEIDNYNYFVGADSDIKEFVGDNSIKNNIKYLKLIKYFSNLKYKSSGGGPETNNTKRLLNDLTIIYNNLKDIYTNIIDEYVKFNNVYEKSGKMLTKNIEYKNPNIKEVPVYANADTETRANSKYGDSSDYNNDPMKKLSVERLDFESELDKLTVFYKSIDTIEKNITALLTDLYKELINLKETVYSTVEYTSIINTIILIYKLKTVEKSDIILELKERRSFLKKKIEELTNFRDLTNKKYSELKSLNTSDRKGYYPSYLDDYFPRRGGKVTEVTEVTGGAIDPRDQRDPRDPRDPRDQPDKRRENNLLLLKETEKITDKITEIKSIFKDRLKLQKLENLIKQNPESEFVEIIKMLEDTLYNNNISDDISNKNANNDAKDGNNDKDGNDEDEKLIYQELWDDYNNGIKAKINSNDDASYFIYIDEGEKLKNKIILNDLDPELVLKINLQDKAVFLMLIFIIRTISVVIIELLIEYNIVKTLHVAIAAYVLLYLSILAIFVVFINLDSYKLRIIFNYLNMHINTSNLAIHLVLFVIFAFLVVIIIQTDDFIKNIGDVLDYTYIYEYLFNLRVDKILDTEFENNLSPDEKTKLLYRLDIVTMIIFIFTGALVIII